MESAHPVAKDVHFNEAAADSVHAGTCPHAYGSVFVKETLDPATLQVSVVTTMQKVDGFRPDAGDWQYGRFDRRDDGTFSGSWSSVEAAQGCIACHAGAADEDYTFLAYLD